MAYKFIGKLVVMVHSKQNPTDAELRAYFEELRTMEVPSVRVLVLTDGGGLSASQRKELNDLLNGHQQMCAVVSKDRLVHGIVTALSWFNRGIKVFAPEAMEEAFKYLGIHASEYEKVWREIRQLRSLINSVESNNKAVR